MAQRTEPLPYNVGTWTPSTKRLIAIAAAVAGVGLLAYLWQFLAGLVVTNLRDVGPMNGAPWGLYIAFDVVFVGISFAGISTAALIRLANLDDLRPVARMAELLTIIALLLASGTIIADLGQPLRGLINLFVFARPQSPFFGTFTLVIAGYLAASLVYFYLDSRADAALCAKTPGRLQGLYRRWAAGYTGRPAERERHSKASFWLAVAILPLLVVAHSTLGFVFGLQVGRPGWFSALQAPSFVVLAGISGLGVLIVIAVAFRKTVGREQLGPTVFRWLAKFQIALLVAYGYFTVVELLTVTYAAGFKETEVWRAILGGPYAVLYWPAIAGLIVSLILYVQYLRGRAGLQVLVWAGGLVTVAAVFKRLIIVVPSLTHGTLLPYGAGSYWPGPVEIAIVGGLIAVGVIAYVVFSKIFPIAEIPEDGSSPGDRASEEEVDAA